MNLLDLLNGKGEDMSNIGILLKKEEYKTIIRDLEELKEYLEIETRHYNLVKITEEIRNLLEVGRMHYV
jgi:hypothetical protein